MLCIYVFFFWLYYKTIISRSVILWRHVQYGVFKISKEKKIKIVVPLQEGKAWAFSTQGKALEVSFWWQEREG